MKKILIVTNWKLNGTKKTIKKLIKKYKKIINKTKNIKIIIAPPLIYLDYTKKKIKKINIELAAQNIDLHLSGAYTGETSIKMLKDIGIKYVIIGHSERKIYHNENNNIIEKKFNLVNDNRLIPILCIGENYTEYKNNQTKKICIQQIKSILKNTKKKLIKKLIIAYEPIWSIGTNKYPKPKEIQKINKYIKSYIYKKYKELHNKTIIQYGGSVNINNFYEIIKQPNVDGTLIGNASLNGKNFVSMIKQIL
ncbi:Triosephosphate isomerase [Candidatus Purcelliella pentastirinorum]|uniref:Triosephosphate isomerase n=1 Tax=Candidatus Purcelliella pentastirinorum TaxID=472834 RepID=A0A346DZJ9_9ENTR|nr:triose-phosphate isomerase [Candidatus Purcelliella pentastirinorum]AXN02154.1 Triosephosphate isomerase [Candidatus Purcelliella pentastirinorum]